METLLKLALLCEETSLTTFVDSIDDLQILLSNPNPAIHELFDKAFTQTKYCEDVESIDYKVDKPRMLLRSQTSVISQENFNRYINEKQIQGKGILRCVEKFYKTYRALIAEEK